jgi:hypothetical protein
MSLTSPSRAKFVPCHLAAFDPSLLQLSVSVRCHALAAGAIGHSAWSVRVASKALLSSQRMRRSVQIGEGVLVLFICV